MDAGLISGENEPAESCKLLIEKILRSILSEPDAIMVNASTADDLTVFTVRVSELDINRMLGRGGRTVRALRIIVGSVGRRYNRRFHLDIEACLCGNAKRSDTDADSVAEPIDQGRLPAILSPDKQIR